MNAKDIADLFITATGKVEFYWNFYTGTVLVLMGWLISTDVPLTDPIRALVTVGYLVFVMMNLMGLWGSYTFAEALRQDLLQAPGLDATALARTRAVLAARSFESQKRLAIFIHAVMAAFVLSVVWLAPLGSGNAA